MLCQRIIDKCTKIAYIASQTFLVISQKKLPPPHAAAFSTDIFMLQLFVVSPLNFKSYRFQ